MSETKSPEEQVRAHDCEASAAPGWLTSGYRQNGERWKCPDCGRRWVHVCDEADGCQWIQMDTNITPAEQVRCAHEKVRPTFDYEASKGLSSHEVRQRWPRFFGECPDCRAPQLILYASKEHYYSGNW